MQNRNELCKSFAKQKPFIYKVGVEYFAIGYRVLRKCTNDEIELAKKYEAEWERLFQIIGPDLEEIDLSIIQPFKVKDLGGITREILKKHCQ